MNIEKIKSDPRMPKHVAFIIDGNGRWAKHRGLSRSFGHKVGADNVKKHIEYFEQLEIPNVSFYCFSTENWNRPKKEVDYLMQKFEEMMDDFIKDYLDKDVRIIISGDMYDEKIPPAVREKALKLMDLTKNKNKLIVNLCINYGGRQEILKAVNEIIASNEKDININKFEQHLYTKDMLPLDLVIRTSGEQRSSNFMPWQSTYSEWYYDHIMWPAFSKKDLIKALKNFMKRNRRFGAIKG